MTALASTFNTAAVTQNYLHGIIKLLHWFIKRINILQVLWNYLTLLLYCCLFFTIALLGVGLVVSLFFFKNEVFLFPINQIKRAVYFCVITELTAWVLRTVLSTVRFKISEEITFAIILKNIICDICFR